VTHLSDSALIKLYDKSFEGHLDDRPKEELGAAHLHALRMVYERGLTDGGQKQGRSRA